MSTRRILTAFAVVLISLPPAFAATTQQELTFRVQRVLSAGGTSILVVPEEEMKRQIPNISARLYGVGNLPIDDPYRRAWGTNFAKIMRPPMVAQVWGGPDQRVVRMAGYVDGKWSDLNAQMVREGAALAFREGTRAPYRIEADEAQRRMIGRYAFRQVAWFWANSTPMYALTATPAQDLRIPVAIAMVSASRIEAGYLFDRQVTLLPTGKLQLGPSIVDLTSRGPDLTLVMKSWGGVKTLTFRWRWNGKSYGLLDAAETQP